MQADREGHAWATVVADAQAAFGDERGTRLKAQLPHARRRPHVAREVNMQVPGRASRQHHVAHVALQPAEQQQQLGRRDAVGAGAILNADQDLVGWWGGIELGCTARKRDIA
jgi:hypothetical protein